MSLPHNLTAEQINQVRDLVAQGNYGDAWSQLAEWGDSYADNAADVTGTPTSIYGEVMHELVEQHWNNTAGPGAYDQYFDQVAEMHLDNYLRILTETGNWPSTREIELSYREAITAATLPVTTAIDGVITRSLGDATNGWVDWPLGLGIESERITPSDVFNDVDSAQARAILAQDLLDTLQSFWNQGAERFQQAFDALRGAIGDFCTGAQQQALDAVESLKGWLKSIGQDVSTLYTSAQQWTAPRRDPLTLDLDADGIETVGINNTNPILFDHDGDGIKTATGWIKSDDGFLVLDRNGNGLIDNGRELFGDSTPLAGGGNAVDGFAALAEEDTNHDGKVNNLDARWNQLRLWRDFNQDGISQANELYTLDSQSIAAINVAKTENNTVIGNGNVLADLGTYKERWQQRWFGYDSTIGRCRLKRRHLPFELHRFRSHYPAGCQSSQYGHSA